MQPAIDDVLERCGNQIEKRLDDLFKDLIEKGDGYHPQIGDLYRAIEDYCMRGGKRLAAASTVMSYRGYSGSVDDRIMTVACGIELYRHSILIHDDLVDRDDLRRGKETLHRLMEKGKDPHFGEGTAVFAGNMLYSLAVNTILSSGFPDHMLMKAVGILSREYLRVNESQVLDLLFEYMEPEITEWELMASRRAASLFTATMGIGAMLGGAPEAELEKIKEAAVHIGFAFDIQDDIIDTFADEEEYGRKPCGDLTKGKKPLHILLAIKRSERFRTMMERSKTGEEISTEEIRAAIIESGALAEAKRVAADHVEACRKILADTAMREKSKEFFLSLLGYITESLSWYR